MREGEYRVLNGDQADFGLASIYLEVNYYGKF